MRRALVLATALLALAAPAAHAHAGNPNFRSIIDTVAPKVPGVQFSVLGYDSQFQVVNHSTKPVVIYGYEGEPYARLLPDGTVEQNTKSPATYLNEDYFGDITVPKTADPKAPPVWKVVDKTHQFIWHDHRMHWMLQTTPPQVKNKSKKTLIDNYSVPLQIGASKGALHGTLFWVGQTGGGLPVGAIVGLVIILALGGGAVVVVRRRRELDGDDDDRAGHGPGDSGDSGDAGEPRTVTEAW